VISFLGYDPDAVGEPRTLDKKVLQYRKSCGMSQKELAKQIGIDPTTLSRLERSQGRCFISVLKKVAAFLNSRTSHELIIEGFTG
jgi:transcriptional regulator with XRE-family HTH domain